MACALKFYGFGESVIMLTKRRPIKARGRVGRRHPASIDFPQLRKEVLLFSNIGVILKQSRFIQETQHKLSDQARSEG